MEENKLTTAEIKEFIMNCVQDGSTYTVAQLKQYISRRTDKLYTPGQISGALMQLTAMDKIQSRGRGLYIIGGNVGDTNTHLRGYRENMSEAQIRFREQIRECMETTAVNLQRIVNQIDMWEATDEEFEFLGEIRKLNDQMKKIASKC